jgi:hypothetical protein
MIVDIIGVVNMPDIKKHTACHLRSVRQWLTRAEESFDKEKDIRGELDLFLAKAELQHVQEVNRYKHWRYKYPLLRQGLAFGLAMVVACAGVGGSYLWLHVQQQGAVLPIPLAGPVTVQQVVKQPVSAQQELMPVSQDQNNVQSAASPKIVKPVENNSGEVPNQQVSFRATDSQQKNKPSTPQVSAQENILSPDEMQKVVRAAGKSLRGQ